MQDVLADTMDTHTVFYPEKEEELLNLLGEDTAVLNGGTDIHVKIRAKKWPYRNLVSLQRVRSLKGISEEGKYVRIRCRTTHSELLAHSVIREQFPLLWKAVYEIGSTQIRNRGTLAGNVVNASPAGDGILALVLYEAWLEISSKNGQKRLSQVQEFITAPGKTTLKPDEFLHSVILQKPERKYSSLFYKIGLRKAMAIAIASMGVLLEIKGDRIKELRIAFGSVAPTVVRVREIEERAFGQVFNRVNVQSWQEFVGKRINPIDDIRATAQYRRDVCRNLVLKVQEMNPQ